eukprot:CAMPEP_0182928648 /NCGR_PEP_ID=MMETSP0105_2-20130417/15693_1 /TAXON_ID=81532 ORGANISM="Acanthoeca-like sp., Strain 10tr" /NCGR_SAMPLE_ID=MMETSP0105_2 /ASSEMBLY_ACC=CAM_ASM_000205 /LENGTH=422 /DNA_ID=CAMNT_0025066653 /DNA_START=37 /DNA_END=1305 /DNA_ORIENTATION=-
MIVVVAGLLSTALTQQAGPTITAQPGGNLTVRIPQGAAYTVQTFDPSSGQNGDAYAILSQNDYDQQSAVARGQIQNELNQAIFNAMVEVRANNTATQAVLAQGLSALNTSASTSIAALTQQVAALQSAVSALSAVITTNVSCPAYPALTAGTVSGHGNHPGSVRVLHCGVGFYLSNTSTVVCMANGQWSDFGTTRCTPTSPAPTPVPTPSTETVTCCVTVDNSFYGAWADGRRLVVFDSSDPPTWATPLQFQFPSTTRVLSLHMLDGECGCLCGWFVIQCGTPSGVGRWNFVSPAYDVAQQMGSAYGQMWNMLTVTQSRFSSISIPPTWTAPTFSNFTGWAPPVGGGVMAPAQAQRLQAQGSSWVRTRFHNSNLNLRLQCPPLLNGTTFATNTLQAASAMCGGLYDRQPRRFVHWFLRITPQ